MPIRELPLVTGSYYHVLNRGVAKLPTFLDDHDYRHALTALEYYTTIEPPMRLSELSRLHQSSWRRIRDELRSEPKLVEIVAFSLMPNHFHLLLKQLVDDGITTLLRRWLNSYSRYFNTRHDRVGSLFQGVFKAVLIHSTEQLVHVSRYIHINAPVAGIIPADQVAAYPWSSMREYLGAPGFCKPDIILEQFQDARAYEAFVLDQIDYARQLDAIKHLTLE